MNRYTYLKNEQDLGIFSPGFIYCYIQIVDDFDMTYVCLIQSVCFKMKVEDNVHPVASRVRFKKRLDLGLWFEIRRRL